MTYENALSYIKKTLNFGSKPGLERIEKLLNALDNPHKNLKFIHIGGTNGKGSTTMMTSNILQNAGYVVGRYISPYVYEFGERISINNINITPEKLAFYVEKIQTAIKLNQLEDDHPTEFEIITALAFLYFRDENCDFVCLEVGLGGRFDATNIIDSPFLSVITKISLDHTQILGDTLEKIAYEKCGIIKNSHTITYAMQDEKALQVIREHSNNCIIPDKNQLKILHSDLTGNKFIYKAQEYETKLLGEHQIYNALTVIEIAYTLIKLGVKITAENIKFGVNTTTFNARMEIISENPLTIIDGSHNLDGINSLCFSIKNMLKGKKIALVFSMLADKDYKASIQKITSIVDFVYFVPIDNIRASNTYELQKYSKCTTSIVCENVENAFKMLKNVDKDVILVAGSLYLAKDVKKFLNTTNSNKLLT